VTLDEAILTCPVATPGWLRNGALGAPQVSRHLRYLTISCKFDHITGPRISYNHKPVRYTTRAIWSSMDCATG